MEPQEQQPGWEPEISRISHDMAGICRRITRLEEQISTLKEENRQLKAVVDPVQAADNTRTWGISTKRASVLYAQLKTSKKLQSSEVKRLLKLPHNSQAIESMRKCAEIYKDVSFRMVESKHEYAIMLNTNSNGTRDVR